jgi:hypothetical protein
MADSARKVFDDFYTQNVPYPILLEGIETADESISNIIANTALESITEKREELCNIICLELKIIFDNFFGKQIEEFKGTFKKA